MSDEIVVVHPFDRLERQSAGRHLGGEIAHITDLLARETDRAELDVARREYGVRRRSVIRIQRVESGKDRRCRLSGQLLEDDRSNECLEMRSFAACLESAGADGLDYSREDRVDALEVADGRTEVSHAGNLRRRAAARCDATAS